MKPDGTRVQRDALGSLCLIAGSLLFGVYATLFPLLLPLEASRPDFGVVVRDADWRWLAAVAFGGILCMMAGFHAIHRRICGQGGWIARLGFVSIEAAYLLQACRVSWEWFLFPVLASDPGAAALLRDGRLWRDSGVHFFNQASSLMILIGVLGFGAAIWRSGAFPKAAALLFVVGAMTYAAGTMVSVYLAIAGILVLTVGCLLLAGRLGAGAVLVGPDTPDPAA